MVSTSIAPEPLHSAPATNMNLHQPAAGRVLITPQDLTKEAAEQFRKYKKLLSLDGGGMRGLITAQVLVKLEDTIKATLCDPSHKLLKHDSSPVDPNFVDIDLADWFDELAGTSTGGLLAIYFASKGGNTKGKFAKEVCQQHKLRPGSAQAAARIYTEYGSTIFQGKSNWRLLKTGGKHAYAADGLEQVLDNVIGDMKLSELKANTVISTVDVDNARTAVFFRQASGSCKDDDQFLSCGFATPSRQAADPTSTKAYLRIKGSNANANSGLGCLQLMQLDEAQRQAREEDLWLLPVSFSELDFPLHQIARATSAAPGYFPSAVVEAVDNMGPKKVGKSEGNMEPEEGMEENEGLQHKTQYSWPKGGLRFVDGGLGNNDPAWMGLAMMLLPQSDKQKVAKLENIAVLSLGTAAASDCDFYLQDRGWKDFLGIAGALVGLTMSINGEDKQNLMRLVFNGLLDRPYGQYTRIQLFHHTNNNSKCSSRDGTSNPLQCIMKAGQAVVLTAGKVLTWPYRKLVNVLSGQRKYQQALARSFESSNVAKDRKFTFNEAQAEAINAMDMADEAVLEFYTKIGKELAEVQTDKIKNFVENFIFNLHHKQKAGPAGTEISASPAAVYTPTDSIQRTSF